MQQVYYIDRPLDPTAFQAPPTPQFQSQPAGTAALEGLGLRSQLSLMGQSISASLQQFTSSVTQSIQDLANALKMTGLQTLRQTVTGTHKLFETTGPTFDPRALQWAQVLPPGPMRTNYTTPGWTVNTGFWSAGTAMTTGAHAAFNIMKYGGLLSLGAGLLGGPAYGLAGLFLTGGAALTAAPAWGILRGFRRPDKPTYIPLLGNIGIFGALQAARGSRGAIEQLPQLMPEEIMEFGIEDVNYRLRGAALEIGKGITGAATTILETLAIMSGGPLALPISFLLRPVAGFTLTNRLADALKILDLTHVGQIALLQYGPRIAPLGRGSGLGGWGFSWSERDRLLRELIEGAYYERGLVPRVDEAITTLSLGLQYGLYDYSNTTQEFLRRHRTLIRASRAVRRILHMSLEESLLYMKEVIAQEGQQYNAPELIQQALRLRRRALSAGLTPEELWRFGAMGAMATRGTLMHPGVAAENVELYATAFGMARAAGAISATEAQQVGGPGGWSNRMLQQSIRFLSQIPLGRAALYYMFNPQTGTIDQQRLVALLTGNVNLNTLLAQPVSNERALAFTAAVNSGRFFNNLPPGTGLALTFWTAYRTAQQLGPQLGIRSQQGVDNLTRLILQQYFGWSPADIEAAAKTIRYLPQAIATQGQPVFTPVTPKQYLTAYIPPELSTAYYHTKRDITEFWLGLTKVFSVRGWAKAFGYEEVEPSGEVMASLQKMMPTREITTEYFGLPKVELRKEPVKAINIAKPIRYAVAREPSEIVIPQPKNIASAIAAPALLLTAGGAAIRAFRSPIKTIESYTYSTRVRKWGQAQLANLIKDMAGLDIPANQVLGAHIEETGVGPQLVIQTHSGSRVVSISDTQKETLTKGFAELKNKLELREAMRSEQDVSDEALFLRMNLYDQQRNRLLRNMRWTEDTLEWQMGDTQYRIAVTEDEMKAALQQREVEFLKLGLGKYVLERYGKGIEGVAKFVADIGEEGWEAIQTNLYTYYARELYGTARGLKPKQREAIERLVTQARETLLGKEPEKGVTPTLANLGLTQVMSLYTQRLAETQREANWGKATGTYILNQLWNDTIKPYIGAEATLQQDNLEHMRRLREDQLIAMAASSSPQQAQLALAAVLERVVQTLDRIAGKLDSSDNKSNNFNANALYPTTFSPSGNSINWYSVKVGGK